MRAHPSARRLLAACLAPLCVACAAPGAAAQTLPNGFTERPILEGLDFPTVVRFASTGEILVAEKDGIVKVFDGPDDPIPRVLADLRDKVSAFGDRGLLGMALDPNYAQNRRVYILYTYAAPIGEQAPDPDHTGPGPEYLDYCVDQCEVGGRLSWLDADGGEHEVLGDDWCNQWSSHSVGTIEFDAQGNLIASAGDGANFLQEDYGQRIGEMSEIDPPNPCGDPPGPEGQALAPPAAEGGALRSQDFRTAGDPLGLSGTVIRVDPQTGDGVPGNPLYATNPPSSNEARLLAYGLRNPFRFALGAAGELWIADTGWRSHEEIERLAPGSGPPNYGWPCYEGPGRQPAYDALDLTLCENLYAPGGGTVTAPFFSYRHGEPAYAGDPCPVPGGGSSISAIGHYDGANFPGRYNGALFFGDYSRPCLWTMLPESPGGAPDPSRVEAFALGAGAPVHLEVGPDGFLYQVDIGFEPHGGRIERLRYTQGNGPPEAVATADRTSGIGPFEVAFDATGSADPDDDSLNYAWDLDGDGQFDDSSSPTPTYEYTDPGKVPVRLRASDGSLTDEDALVVDVGNTPPTATIAAPHVGDTWATGDPITFRGSATDPQTGALAGGALRWDIQLDHCPGSGTACHVHNLLSSTGTSFQLPGPDHEYPSHLTVTLVARDPEGLESEPVELAIDPRSVELRLESQPSGLQLGVNGAVQATPFTYSSIEGATATASAPSPQTVGATAYEWRSWSDGGPRTHVLDTAASGTVLATFAAAAPNEPQDPYEEPPGEPPTGPPAGPPQALSLEVLKLRLPRRAGRLARRGSQALLRCSAACAVEFSLHGQGRRARRAGLAGRLGRARGRLGAGSAEWLRLELGDRVTRRLRRDPGRRVGWIEPRFDARGR